MPTPITCLGKTFPTEDERRSYFRDELEKKLPELRKIEGFPIGTDEDILDLSDPPYYTACPNPWLNDFITQWEEEKKELEKSKQRKADFVVREPYASDVSEGKNNPIYSAHSYHTKVPHPAIMRYILHYTQPGDIVFDGFAGTGMTGVAAQLCGNPESDNKFKIETEFKQMGFPSPKWGLRRVCCGDLSPIAGFISYNYNTPVDVDAFEKRAQRILQKVETECGWMYSTKHTNGKEGRINYTVWSDIFDCPSCGGEIIFWDVAVDVKLGKVMDNFDCQHCHATQTKRSLDKAMMTVFDKGLKNAIQQPKTIPVLISYTYSGKRYEKKPDQFDLEIIEQIEQLPIPYWYPVDRMPEGEESRRNDGSGITHVHHFYYKRTLHNLACANNGTDLRDSILLTPIQWTNTKLYRYRWAGGFAGAGGGPLGGTFYIPSIVKEISVLQSMKNGFNKAVKKKSLYLRKLSNVIFVNSAENNPINDNSIDYIFTDPPFGANIMYSELNFLWESWLKVKTNNLREAIENKSQGKTLLDYQQLMFLCFKEYFRILKPSRWMTVEFSNTSAAVWNGIQSALQRAGFVIANVAALDKKQGSFKAVTTPTAVKQDLVISCYKPSDGFDHIFKNECGEINVWEFIKEHLNHLPITINKEKTTTAVIERSPKILYDRLITFYLMRGLPLPIDAVDFQIKLGQKFRESDGMYFTVEQYVLYQDQKIKQGVTQQLTLVFDIIYSESDAVEWLKARLAKDPEKYQDIQPDFRKANTANRKGEKEFELQTLLSENFIPIPDGRWRVPDMNEIKDREHFRTAALLKEFGRYIEELANPKTKKLKDVRVEALREGFKSSWQKKDFVTIINVAEKIPHNLLMEDEYLLNFYDIAKDMV